jgi:phosphatidate cytidylyltransferase|tara:strand:+ start:2783 stop:3568 length:786 start_codon:yes stop_codon:yes gene_type:complete
MSSKRWGDLPTRFASAAALLIVFAIALTAGRIGILTFGFVVIVAMQWELAQMFGLSGRKLFAVTAIAALGWLPMIVQPLILYAGLTLPSVAGFLPILIGAVLVKSQRGIYICYGAFLTFGMVAFWYLALNFGSFGIGILAALVVLSDVGGYVAGRMIGGIKFWPSISPKKTWSGTIAGWILTAAFGFFLMQYSGDGWMITVSVAVAFGAQLGDIAESWIKRRVGIKDSSNLIPGHGGFLDRFDGFIGGAAVLGITSTMFLN